MNITFPMFTQFRQYRHVTDIQIPVVTVKTATSYARAPTEIIQGYTLLHHLQTSPFTGLFFHLHATVLEIKPCFKEG